MCDHYSCISGPRQLNLLNRQSADWPAAASRDKSDFFPPQKNNFLHFLFWCFFPFVGSVTDWAKVTELHKRIASDGILVEIHLISALFFRHPAELWSRSIRRQAAKGQRRSSGGLRATGKIKIIFVMHIDALSPEMEWTDLPQVPKSHQPINRRSSCWEKSCVIH